MKNLILFTMFFLTCFVSFGQYEKTLIKSFNVNVSDVLFDMDCNKSINKWDKPYIKVELIVKTNFNADILTKNGRYIFESKIDNNILIVNLPNLKNKIRIGESDFIEDITLRVWLPDSTSIKESMSL